MYGTLGSFRVAIPHIGCVSTKSTSRGGLSVFWWMKRATVLLSPLNGHFAAPPLNSKQEDQPNNEEANLGSTFEIEIYTSSYGNSYRYKKWEYVKRGLDRLRQKMVNGMRNHNVTRTLH